MSVPARRGGSVLFSERLGFKEVRTVLQVEGMDQGLRTSLWNAFYAFWVAPSRDVYVPNWVDDTYYQVYRQLWVSFFKLPLDECPSQGDGPEWASFLRKHFDEDPWFQVYDMLEITPQFWNG